jgi:lipopolysaccharide/colanic/teichoic acid biosynthesis glycosyltransferase
VRRHQWRLLAAALLAADVLGVVAGAALAGAVAARWFPAAQMPRGAWLVALMAALAVLGFLGRQLYTRHNLMHGTVELVGVVHGCAYGAIGTVLASFVVSERIPRIWTALAWTFTAAAVCGIRIAIRRGAARLRAHGFFIERTLLVGADQHSIGVARQLGRPGSGIQVVGVLDDYKAPGTVLDGRFTVLGTPADLARIAARRGANDAVVVPDALAWETMRRLLADAATGGTGVRVHLAAGFTDLLTTGVRVSARNHVPLLTVKPAAFTPAEAAAKRALDCAVAALLLAVCSPLLLGTTLRLRALGIAPLRRHAVLGRHGTRFEMPVFDPRGTPSTFVRKLPALARVLRGDMSVVGPRPIPAEEAGALEGPSIRPGLTGHWRESDNPTEQATLDLYYIRSFRPWTDVHVLWTRARARLLPWRRRRPHRALAPRPARGTHGAG